MALQTDYVATEIYYHCYQ